MSPSSPSIADHVPISGKKMKPKWKFSPKISTSAWVDNEKVADGLVAGEVEV